MTPRVRFTNQIKPDFSRVSNPIWWTNHRNSVWIIFTPYKVIEKNGACVCVARYKEMILSRGNKSFWLWAFNAPPPSKKDSKAELRFSIRRLLPEYSSFNTWPLLLEQFFLFFRPPSRLPSSLFLLLAFFLRSPLVAFWSFFLSAYSFLSPIVLRYQKNKRKM